MDSPESPVVRCAIGIMEAVEMDGWNESCQACESVTSQLIKFSLGKDFFGRPYDRLSPLADQNPKWYCAPCSLHKNLQRDFRDIQAEFDKLHAGHSSELSKADEFRRATLRLYEIMTILNVPEQQSPFLSGHDVIRLMEQLSTLTMPA